MPQPIVTNWNISNITNANSTYIDLMRQTSDMTYHVPGTLILLAISIVIFLSLKMKGLPNTHAFAAMCFAQVILGVLMYPLGIITGLHLIIALILLPISALMLYLIR